MHDDLLDAVDWAVRGKVTSPDKVAIMGGSYGGYATLAGLAFTPDRFACGVDIVGPSNLNTLLSTIPPYWEAIRAQLYKRMGDPAAAADRPGGQRSQGQRQRIPADRRRAQGQEHPRHLRRLPRRGPRLRPPA